MDHRLPRPGGRPEVCSVEILVPWTLQLEIVLTSPPPSACPASRASIHPYTHCRPLYTAGTVKLFSTISRAASLSSSGPFRRFRARLSTLGPPITQPMSGPKLPPRPADLLSRLGPAPTSASSSLGSRLSSALPNTIIPSKPLIGSLPPRPDFALPSRPNFLPAPAASSSANPGRGRRTSPSPPIKQRRNETDTYLPSRSPARDSVYIAPPSPVRSDHYEPDYRRPRRRSPSFPQSPPPPRERYRSYHSRSRSRSPPPARSPPRIPESRRRSRSRSRHLERRRSLTPPPPRSALLERSPPPVNLTTAAARRSSRSRSRSPIKYADRSYRPDSPPPRERKRARRAPPGGDNEQTALFLAAKRESRVGERQARREAKLKEKEELERIFAEERARKQKLVELQQKRVQEEASQKAASSLASRIGAAR